MLKKTLLVTGGNGYIGRIFVEYYAKRHPDQQIVIVARTKKPHVQFPENVRIVQSDYGDREKMEQIIDSYHVSQVLHLAAELDKNGSKNNVIKSEALLSAMDNTGVKQIVYGSSFMVYQTPIQPSGKLNEASPTKPSSTENYAESKRAVERMILERNTWRSVILRYSIVIGANVTHGLGDERQNRGIVSTYLDATHYSSMVNMPDDGSTKRDFVDVQDVASATDKALLWVRQQKSPGVIVLNVGSGKPHSINQLIQVVERVTSKSIQVNRVSSSPDVPVSFLDISLIQKILQWKPSITFEKSIENAWRFLTGSNHD